MSDHTDNLEQFYNPMRKDFTQTKALVEDSNGKLKGQQRPAKRAFTAEDLEQHLAGTGPLVGHYQFVDDTRVGWCGIDFDDYTVNFREVCKKNARWNHPFVISKTKSGGLHLECFSDAPFNAAEAQVLMKQWAEAFGFDKFEVFPKQRSIKQDGRGSALQLPMYAILSDKPISYFLDDEGEPIFDVQESLNRIEENRMRKLVSPPLFDGPPCLQRHALDTVEAGSRDIVLFNAGLYARKAFGDDRETLRDWLDNFNEDFVDQPARPQQIGQKVSSVCKQEYQFQCDDPTLERVCNKALCRKRDFGIGGGKPEGAVEIPSNFYSFTECAEDIFEHFQNEETLFRRGLAVVEVDERNSISIVSPSAFQSRIEQAGKLVRQIRSTDGKVKYTGALLSSEHARALLEADARRMLHEIRLISPVPLLNADGSIMSPGFNVEAGVIVTGNVEPQMMDFDEARDTIFYLLKDFQFLLPSDLSRAVANIVTAPLRLSGLMNFPVPFDYSDAIDSQSGKTLRQAITRKIFGVSVAVSAAREKGIGSLDDELATQYYSGVPFVVIDNHKSDYNSPYMEAALTAPDQIINVRLMRQNAQPVFIGRQILQMSSNDATLTEDMLNRACIVTIRKQPPEYVFTHPDLLDHIEGNRAKYLGACLSIARAAITDETLAPRQNVFGHDLRQWLSMVAPIIERMGLEPITDKHEEKKVRLSGKKGGNFLLQIVAKMEDGVEMTATEIIEKVIEPNNISWPGNKEPDTEKGQSLKLGQVLGQAFGEESCISVEEFEFHRITEERYSEKRRKDYIAKTYRKGDAPECPY